MITARITPSSLKAVREQLSRLSGPEMREALAKALNDTGFKVRREMQKELKQNFDKPTPYILRSANFQGAKPGKLSIRVAPTYMGGKGIDPQQILQAQEFGGSRKDKRSEVALRRAGILPNGYQTVIPSEPYPGSHDNRGNMRGPFLTKLLSYFQAQGEQGYRSNMTAKRKAKLADRTTYSGLATRKTYRMIRGAVFFVSYGKLRSGATSHLAPGIWAKTGIHGVTVKPVLMFTRAGTYRPAISMERIARNADVQPYLDRRVRFRIRQAAENKLD